MGRGRGRTSAVQNEPTVSAFWRRWCEIYPGLTAAVGRIGVFNVRAVGASGQTSQEMQPRPPPPRKPVNGRQTLPRQPACDGDHR